MQYRRLATVLVGIMVMVSIGCLTMTSLSCATDPAIEAPAAPPRFFAMRVEDPHGFSTETQQRLLIDFCLEYGINRLLVRIEQAAPSPKNNHPPRLLDADPMSRLIALAAGHGIEVEAMAQPASPNTQAPFAEAMALLGAILDFNHTLPPGARLTGIHYDLSGDPLAQLSDRQRQAAMQRRLEFIERARAKIRQENPPVRLSATIPSWYDNLVDGEAPFLVDYYGSYKNFHEHLQDLTDDLVVMCPRRTGKDDDLVSEPAKAELGYAQWVGRSVGVGIDTARQLEKPGATYYGRPAWEFWLHKHQAQQALASHPAFGGVVVNNYTTFSQMLSVQSRLTQSEPAAHQSTIFGMWVWRQKWILSEEAQDKVLAFCETYHINLLPVQIHFDPKSIRDKRPRLKNEQMLRKFIEKANQKGVRIEALDGAPEMGLAKNRHRVLAMLDAITAFNKTLAPHASFSGLHYDIEPYLLPEWKTPKREQVMREYLELLEAAALKLKLDAPGMLLSASIPFWYDLKTSAEDHCILEYNGQKKNFHEHIQDLTDYVAIMSYRNRAMGDDSITYHVEVERAYAEWIGKYICAGMETIEIKDRPEITFYSLPPSEFWFQKHKLDQVLGRRGGFGGILVHSYESFAPYLQRDKKPSK